MIEQQQQEQEQPIIVEKPSRGKRKNPNKKDKHLYYEQLAKQYFTNDFIADTTIRPLNRNLVDVIMSYEPESVFEFGCGTCKNLLLLEQTAAKSGLKLNTYGMDINPKAIDIAKNNNPSLRSLLIEGDENTLHEMTTSGKLRYMDMTFNIDVSFTCGCLDHLPYLKDVVTDLQKISNKAVLCYETNSIIGRYYYGHNYGKYDMVKMPRYKYLSTAASGGDGGLYWLWSYNKNVRDKGY